MRLGVNSFVQFQLIPFQVEGRAQFLLHCHGVLARTMDSFYDHGSGEHGPNGAHHLVENDACHHHLVIDLVQSDQFEFMSIEQPHSMLAYKVGDQINVEWNVTEYVHNVHVRPDRTAHENVLTYAIVLQMECMNMTVEGKLFEANITSINFTQVLQRSQHHIVQTAQIGRECVQIGDDNANHYGGQVGGHPANVESERYCQIRIQLFQGGYPVLLTVLAQSVGIESDGTNHCHN